MTTKPCALESAVTTFDGMDETLAEGPLGQHSLFEGAYSSAEDEADQLRRDEAGFYIGQMRGRLGSAEAFTSRIPCPRCRTTAAWLTLSGGQNSVRCQGCGRFLYNAPKTETGERAETVATLRRGIKHGQQSRIFERDHGRCLLCGSREDLVLGHLLSVKDGLDLGVDAAHLTDDANLAAMCQPCNAGLHSRSVSLRTYVIFMWRLLQAEVKAQASTNVRPLRPTSASSPE